MASSSASEMGWQAAEADHATGNAPLWERLPGVWEKHSDSFRRAYRRRRTQLDATPN